MVALQQRESVKKEKSKGGTVLILEIIAKRKKKGLRNTPGEKHVFRGRPIECW